MAKAITMRVLAHGGILVLDAEYAKATGRRAYVGRREVKMWDESALPDDCPCHHQYNEFIEKEDKRIPHTAYPKLDSPVSVPANGYYRKQVRVGALLAADEATARECGVRFDSTFGGEYPNLVKSARVRGKEGD